jgi:hypothetical protein
LTRNIPNKSTTPRLGRSPRRGNLNPIAKLLFIPFSVVGGLIAGFLGRQLFAGLWRLVDDQEAPEPSHREVEWWKVIVASTMKGAVFAGTKAMADRGSRSAFMSVTGTWPGEKEPDT